MIILGIDPGSRITGYGLIKQDKRQLIYIDSGCIRLSNESSVGHGRLRQIFEGVLTLMEQYQPAEVAIERVFLYQNVNTALKLGEARGAAIAAVSQKISEYAPREVKQAIAGYGAAKKEQVQFMVRAMLKLKHMPAPDEADALAIAVCHAHRQSLQAKMIDLKVPKNTELANLLCGQVLRRGRKR